MNEEQKMIIFNHIKKLNYFDALKMIEMMYELNFISLEVYITLTEAMLFLDFVQKINNIDEKGSEALNDKNTLEKKARVNTNYYSNKNRKLTIEEENWILSKIEEMKINSNKYNEYKVSEKFLKEQRHDNKNKDVKNIKYLLKNFTDINCNDSDTTEIEGLKSNDDSWDLLFKTNKNKSNTNVYKKSDILSPKKTPENFKNFRERKLVNCGDKNYLNNENFQNKHYKNKFSESLSSESNEKVLSNFVKRNSLDSKKFLYNNNIVFDNKKKKAQSLTDNLVVVSSRKSLLYETDTNNRSVENISNIYNTSKLNQTKNSQSNCNPISIHELQNIDYDTFKNLDKIHNIYCLKNEMVTNNIKSINKEKFVYESESSSDSISDKRFYKKKSDYHNLTDYPHPISLQKNNLNQAWNSNSLKYISSLKYDNNYEKNISTLFTTDGSIKAFKVEQRTDSDSNSKEK